MVATQKPISSIFILLKSAENEIQMAEARENLKINSISWNGERPHRSEKRGEIQESNKWKTTADKTAWSVSADHFMINVNKAFGKMIFESFNPLGGNRGGSY